MRRRALHPAKCPRCKRRPLLMRMEAYRHHEMPRHPIMAGPRLDRVRYEYVCPGCHTSAYAHERGGKFYGESSPSPFKALLRWRTAVKREQRKLEAA